MILPQPDGDPKEAWAQQLVRMTQDKLTELEQKVAFLESVTLTAFVLPTYTVATLPDAATWVRGLIYVSDGELSRRIAFSNGTNWLWIGTGQTTVVA